MFNGLSKIELYEVEKALIDTIEWKESQATKQSESIKMISMI